MWYVGLCSITSGTRRVVSLAAFISCLGIRITNGCGRYMAIILINCVKGLGMGLVGMQVEGLDNVVVVETVARILMGLASIASAAYSM